MIIFENPGVLDERSLFVMGLNAKTTDSAIGYFGTGLKYAVAIAARLGWSCTIQFGDGTEAKVEAKPAEFRGKDFTIPRLRDRDLPFTTELGKNWAPWQAYRELVCNAWDEGGRVRQSAQRPAPEQGTIRFILAGVEIEEAHANHNQYFFDDKQAVAIGTIQRNETQPGGIYCRGILVGNTPEPSRFGYNYSNRLEISEDRVLMQTGVYGARFHLAEQVSNVTDRDILAPIFIPAQDSYEETLPLYTHSINKSAMEYARELYDSGSIEIHPRLAHHFQSLDRERNPFKQLPLTARDEDIIARVKELMAERGWDLDYYNIKWKCDFGTERAYGVTRGDKIGIGVRAFDDGLTSVLATTLEEYVHAKFGYDDTSREFQDWFVRQLALEMENG